MAKEQKVWGEIFYHHANVRQLMSMDEPHYHNHYELYYLLAGTRKYFVGSQIIHVQKGDVVLIPRGVLHRTTYMSSGRHERLLINFSDDGFFGDALSCFSRVRISVPQSSRRKIETLFFGIEQEYKKQDSFRMPLMKCYLYELLVFLCRLEHNSSPPKPMGETEQIIRDAADYIQKHFENPLSLAFLAKRAAMSPGYFSKSFKRFTGMGLCEYITYVRVLRACPLLEDTSFPITEVAARCGYTDSNYFASVFKRIKGTTPKKYRQIWQKQ